MDDGSRQKGQGIYLATHSFNYEDVQTLSNLLIEKYSFSGLPSDLQSWDNLKVARLEQRKNINNKIR
jgi:hypothetical protein